MLVSFIVQVVTLFDFLLTLVWLKNTRSSLPRLLFSCYMIFSWSLPCEQLVSPRRNQLLAGYLKLKLVRHFNFADVLPVLFLTEIVVQNIEHYEAVNYNVTYVHKQHLDVMNLQKSSVVTINFNAFQRWERTQHWTCNLSLMLYFDRLATLTKRFKKNNGLLKLSKKYIFWR